MLDGNNLLEAALAYAETGWLVLPIRRGAKIPLTAHGVKDASRDEKLIRRWWAQWIDANIGVATGAPSGVIVFDIDGAEGVMSFGALEREYGPLLTTRRVRTGREGGEHLYFQVEEAIRTQQLAPKLGVRGEGAYVLAPPSIHPNGARYEVIDQRSPRPLPDGLLRLLKRHTALAPKPSTDRGEIAEGQRNVVLTSLAGTMRRRGMTPEAIEAALLAENEQRCRPPLLADEVRKIAKSISNYAPQTVNCPAKVTKSAADLDNARTAPYQIEDGRLSVEKLTPNGLVTLPLANFTARITEEIVLDDGLETKRAFLIEGQLDTGKKLDAIRIPADKFSTMGWVVQEWGVPAVICAGQAKRDQLREAIQKFSTDAKQRHVFTHTGWRQVDGDWFYLTANGAIGRDGFRPGFDVELSSDLRTYALPKEVKDLRMAIEASLRLLDIAPLTITAPLLAAVFRAPLATFWRKMQRSEPLFSLSHL
jgi:hypothetical protein